MKKNYIAVVLDNSGSMQSVQAPAERAFNAVVSQVREEALRSGQETSVTYLMFGVGVTTVFYNSSAASLQPTYSFRPHEGGTALWDGVGKAVEMLADAARHETGDTSFLVITVTDGGENNSKRYTALELSRLVREKQNTDRWSFTFQVPPRAAAMICNQLGVPSGNVREWEQTEYGTQMVGATASAGVTQYFNLRSAGQTRVDDFYVTTDLSKVTPKKVAQKLHDISDRFNAYTVGAETEVKPFVERRTSRPYVIGSAYYTLMKPETVQPHKRVLIMEKGKKAVWGGDEARQLIGLPKGWSVKVMPGNHSNYDIYVQSTSVNRKLPRGTKVLVDTTQLASQKPTWGTVLA